MRILFVWPGFTGYMGDCWRALRMQPGVTLKVFIDGVGLGERFSEATMSALDWERVDVDSIIARTQEYCPDVIFVVGWRRAVPRRIAFAGELQNIRKFLVMDMPWRWSLRCFAARFVLARYVKRFDGVLVHGRSSATYAHWLGFSRVFQHSICGVDLVRFASCAKADDERRGFLFVGRSSSEKGIEVLKAATERYRQLGGSWAVTVPEWLDPEHVPQMMGSHACLVLPSKWEPWGVVVAEAKAAGMNVIVSDRVVAREDLPCDAVFAAGDVEGLAQAMLRLEWLPLHVEESRRQVETFSTQAWANRVLSICSESGENVEMEVKVK